MKLNFFIYAINVKTLPGGPLNAENILSVMNIDYLPGAFSFSIVFNIFGMDEGEDHIVKIKFFNKDDNEIILETDSINLPKSPLEPDESVPAEYRGYMMTLDFKNVVFKKPGAYSTTIIVDGVEFADNDIYVKGKDHK